MAEFDIDKLRETFASIDKDKSGTVNEAELTGLLKKHTENASRASEISKKVFEHIGTSEINFTQFSKALEGLKKHASGQ